MSKLATMRESRTKAVEALDALLDAHTEALAERALTDEERSAAADAEKRVADFDAAITREEAAEERAAKIEEARKAALGSAGDVDHGAHVTSEPRTYDAESRTSYFYDLAAISMPSSPAAQAAAQRMAAYRNELDRELSQSPASKESKYLRSVNRDLSRSVENRTGDTSTTNNATIPAYLTDYVLYNQPGRVFVDQCNKQDMPDYGMTVSVPVINGSGAVASQGGDDNAFSVVPVTSGWATAAITTLAGGNSVSIQLLERSGLQSDKAIFEQLTADYNQQADVFAINGALTGAGNVAYTGTWAAPEFRSKILGAVTAIETSAGLYRSPGHLFLNPMRYNALAASVDDEGRPLIVDRNSGPLNAFTVQPGASVPEGWVGGNLAGLDVYKDTSIPLTGGATPTEDQAIVSYMPANYWWESELIPETLPQATVGSYGAGTLTVLLRIRAYVAYVNVRPASVQVVTGSAMSPYSF